MDAAMLCDFEFKDDDRRVLCTRGVRDVAAGNTTDDRWWYLCVERARPVRLGETRSDVWHSALRHLDGLE